MIISFDASYLFLRINSPSSPFLREERDDSVEDKSG